jgi:hypothetical protein
MTVTVQSALSALAASVGRLRDSTRELELIAVEDRPRRGDVHLVDVVQHAAFEVAGEAEQAVRAIRDRDVVRCQEHVNRLGGILVGDLAAPERLAELGGLGGRHGREAGAWSAEVVRCVEACQRALWTAVQPAVLAYWRELTDQTNDHDSMSGVGR